MLLSKATILAILSWGIVIVFVSDDAWSTEAETTPSVQQTLQPPSDLLFQSIRKELEINRDLRAIPTEETPSPSSPMNLADQPKTDQPKMEQRSPVEPNINDSRPWAAIESLLIAARKLEQQAARLEKKNEAKMGMLLREKSMIIRQIVVELLTLNPNDLPK